MPTIGEPARFAVEYGLDPAHGGVWLFGKVRFWIGGESIGNFDLGTSLRDVLFQLEGGRRDHGRRKSSRFASMPADLVVKTLDAAFFGSSDPDIDRIAVEEEWARHQLKPEVDVFDDWTLYLVESEDSARLLYRFNADETKQFILSPGECDRILEEACRALGALYASQPGAESAD